MTTLRAGSAVVGEIADAHEKHKVKRLERERVEAAAAQRGEVSSHPIRPSTVTITEVSDSEDEA